MYRFRPYTFFFFLLLDFYGCLCFKFSLEFVTSYSPTYHVSVSLFKLDIYLFIYLFIYSDSNARRGTYVMTGVMTVIKGTVPSVWQCKAPELWSGCAGAECNIVLIVTAKSVSRVLVLETGSLNMVLTEKWTHTHDLKREREAKPRVFTHTHTRARARARSRAHTHTIGGVGSERYSLKKVRIHL